MALMSKPERLTAIIFLFVAVCLSSILAVKTFNNKTVPVPSSGGTYREGLLGEIRYINPVLASSDNDRSITSLIFSGLINFNDKNEVIPDLAKSWEVSGDQKSYTFKLKNNIVFHNGQALTSGDISHTINRIKSLENKSPLFDFWKDVTVSTPTEDTVVFELSKPYGPFIYSCNFGVLPSSIPDEVLSKTPIGTGKYQFNNIEKKNEAVNRVVLVKNEDYYDQKPFLNQIEYQTYEDEKSLSSAITQDKLDAAIFSSKLESLKSYPVSSTKKLGLILNTLDPVLKDKEVRNKIIEGQETFSPEFSIRLDTVDSEPQKSRAFAIKEELAIKNINVNVKLNNSVAMMDVLKNHSYQLLLYGFDFGKDGDPYIFWHSTQSGKSNLSNWSSKETDVLTEDARMITDSAQRSLKYAEIYSKIDSEYLVKYYDLPDEYFETGANLKGVDERFSSGGVGRYCHINDWYKKEKRVKR